MNIDICNGIKNVVMSNLTEILSLRNTGRLKSDKSFVSDGDLFCQKIILDWISTNLTSSHIIISEESENDLTNLESVE